MKIIDKIFSSEYIKNISTLVLGSFFAQLIAFLTIPILSRLYLPEDFGTYSTFITLAGIFGLVSNFLYDRSIILPKSNTNALNLFVGSIFLASIFSAFLLALLLILDGFFNINFISSGMLFLISLRVVQLGFFQPIEQVAIRKENFFSTATIKSFNSLLTSIVQVFSKVTFSLAGGLVYGKVFSDILSTLFLFIFNRSFFQSFRKRISFHLVLQNFKKHILFPKFQLPSILANTLSQGMPIIFLGYFYSLEIAGFYGMSIRLLKQPTELIASSTQNVFYQKASSLHQEKKSILDLYTSTTFGLIKIYLLPLFLILLFAPTIFSFFLGAQWVQSGTLAQILVLWCFFSFIKPPSMMLFNILKLQKIQLKIEILQFIFRAFALMFGYYVYESFISSILFFTIVSCIFDLFTILYLYQSLLSFERKKLNKKIRVAFVISGLGQGGAERVLTKVSNDLVQEGLDVSIISGYQGDSAYYINSKVKVHYLGYYRLNSYNIFRIFFPTLKRMKLIKDKLNELNPDVIISFGDSTNVQTIIANKFLRIKSARHIISIRTNPTKINFQLKVAAILFYRFSNLLVVQTAFVKNWARKRFKRLNIKTIYNPIDISPLNEKKDIINFLNVGTIKFEKNHLLLLKSFNKIHHSLNNQSKLIIVGGIESNELYKKLLHFIEKNNLEDKVVFKGAKKNVNNYYCNNNIFVLSSIYEGMSNALLEAMSLESACISTDYEGINEIIINNETGLIVQSNNIDRLASSMLKLYKSRKTRLKLGKNARLKIISDFEKNKILKQWLNVIIDTK